MRCSVPAGHEAWSVLSNRRTSCALQRSCLAQEVLTGVAFSLFSIKQQLKHRMWIVSNMLGSQQYCPSYASLQKFLAKRIILILNSDNQKLPRCNVRCWLAPFCAWPLVHIQCTPTFGKQLKSTEPTWCIWLIIWDLQHQKRKTEGY